MQPLQLQLRAAGDLHLIKSKKSKSKKNKNQVEVEWWWWWCWRSLRCRLFPLVTVSDVCSKTDSRSFGHEHQNGCFHVRRRGRSSGQPDAGGDAQLLWVSSASLEPTGCLARLAARLGNETSPPPTHTPLDWLWNSPCRSATGTPLLCHRSGCLLLVTLNASCHSTASYVSEIPSFSFFLPFLPPSKCSSLRWT